METPTLVDVLDARRFIAPYLPPTPFQLAEELSERLGFEAWIKYESAQPIRAFKVRGGVYLVGKMSPEERARGLVTASTGNHGQSIAYAGRLFGARVIVAAPKGANPVKVAAMRRLGAEVVETGPDFDAAREWAERTAAEQGMRHVHAANEPKLIAGVGTMSVEMMERLPELDAVIAPIGAGSCACGHCIAGKTIKPALEVFGVQSEGACAVWRAYHGGTMAPSERIETFAEGLATRVPFELPLRILRERLDDFVLVSDDDLRRAMVALIETTRTLAEGAGAAATAGAFKLRERLRGKKVGIVVTGANVTVAGLREALAVAARG